jgi:hypothetical protein
MTGAYRRTMLRLGLFLTATVGGCIFFACSSSSDGSGANAMGDGGPLFVESGPVDSAPPPPDYRDPRAADGACNPPNKICGDAGDDGGDSGFGGCTAVTLDHDNCGACDNACIGVDSVCISGLCDCNATGFDYCAGTGCMDVTADTNNCGSCGNVCDPNQFNACINSVCDNN